MGRGDGVNDYEHGATNGGMNEWKMLVEDAAPRGRFLVSDMEALPHPLRRPRVRMQDSGNPGFINRILIGTATTGQVRIEWVNGRLGQIVPPNWSAVTLQQPVSSFVALRYQVAHAQNLIVKEALDGDFEWLLLFEHDVILPANAFLLLDEHMRRGDTPVVSGLYFQRSVPAQPLVYRGRGTGYYGDWMPEFLAGKRPQVWADGVPTGCLLVHSSLLRVMWADARPYTLDGIGVRELFETPRDLWFDETTGQYNTMSGTSDLKWCSDVINGDYLRKAGWHKLADKEFPFLVDTRLFCRHINPDGQQFPVEF